MESTNNYKHLEFADGNPIPYIKGTGRNVGTIGIIFNAWKQYKSPQDLAKDSGLPIDAVVEDLDWYNKNKELVTIECAKERAEIGVEN